HRRTIYICCWCYTAPLHLHSFPTRRSSDLGIPMGAKSTSDLTAQNKIQISEGNFLISMCNNASPMFIIGYIAISQLKLPRIKYPDRKSTRLNSSHVKTSYAVFCLKKKNDPI